MINVTVLFDSENQLQEMALLKSWKLPYHFNFKSYTIKEESSNMQDVDINTTTLFVILLGVSTRFLGSHFMEDIQTIIQSTRAIWCLNLNQITSVDEKNSPRLLWDCGTVNMPFKQKDVEYFFNAIKFDIRENYRTGSLQNRNHPRPFDAE